MYVFASLLFFDSIAGHRGIQRKKRDKNLTNNHSCNLCSIKTVLGKLENFKKMGTELKGIADMFQGLVPGLESEQNDESSGSG